MGARLCLGGTVACDGVDEVLSSFFFCISAGTCVVVLHLCRSLSCASTKSLETVPVYLIPTHPSLYLLYTSSVKISSVLHFSQWLGRTLFYSSQWATVSWFTSLSTGLSGDGLVRLRSLLDARRRTSLSHPSHQPNFEDSLISLVCRYKRMHARRICVLCDAYADLVAQRIGAQRERERTSVGRTEHLTRPSGEPICQ